MHCATQHYRLKLDYETKAMLQVSIDFISSFSNDVNMQNKTAMKASVEGADISPAMEDEERRRKIRDFTFDKCKRGNQGFQRILLQLFGYLGHGKSSFINTVMCVWSNK
ncbi:unnamed protein product [Ranitomeya imitator]|uniref:Uncharacterized protein n=1 Tax=Ranitomeya imitator TaxID=111125 RepID=A0ABN9LSD7_9NEOB|nr:unnamed protein product [Ranitomeya imitator]